LLWEPEYPFAQTNPARPGAILCEGLAVFDHFRWRGFSQREIFIAQH
jgi:hypothetical protein